MLKYLILRNSEIYLTQNCCQYEHRLFSKVNSGLLGKFHSFGLFVKIQWRHVTEQSCVENQVKPSLEDQEDVK